MDKTGFHMHGIPCCMCMSNFHGHKRYHPHPFHSSIPMFTNHHPASSSLFNFTNSHRCSASHSFPSFIFACLWCDDVGVGSSSRSTSLPFRHVFVTKRGATSCNGSTRGMASGHARRRRTTRGAPRSRSTSRRRRHVDFEAKGWDATRTMEGMAQAARWDASDGLQRERR